MGMAKTRILGLGLLAAALLAVLSALFNSLDFYAGQSQNTTESSVATVSSGEPGAWRQGRPAALHVYVEGEGPLEDGLRDELHRELEASGRFGEVVVTESPGGTTPNLLAVAVRSSNQRWSGVYAQAEVQVVSSFSTKGGIYYPGEGTVHFDGGPSAVAHGTFSHVDSTYGLLSLNGYQRALGRQLASEVAQSLLAQFNPAAA
jgi:hypothetical protein